MRARSADIIREALEQDIVTGVFAPGEHLDEVRLAERFSVSRTPVREAFQVLASEGFVDLKPRRGAFVSIPDFTALLEMFDVIAELEGMACRLAATQADERDIERIEDATMACEHALETGDADIYFRENERFHEALLLASGNRFLQSEASRLSKRLEAYRRLQLHARGRLQESMDEHRLILEAIRNGDGEEAERCAKAHKLVQGKRFKNFMESYRTVARSAGTGLREPIAVASQ